MVTFIGGLFLIIFGVGLTEASITDSQLFYASLWTLAGMVSMICSVPYLTQE